MIAPTHEAQADLDLLSAVERVRVEVVAWSQLSALDLRLPENVRVVESRAPASDDREGRSAPIPYLFSMQQILAHGPFADQNRD